MNESKFTGGVLGDIGTKLLLGLMCAFTFGLAAPWGICIRQRWIADHTLINGKQLYFDGNGGQLFVKFIVWLLLCIVTLNIYVLWVSVKLQQWKTEHTHFRS